VLGQSLERLVPIPFDHLFPPDSLHLVHSLNQISGIPDSFASSNFTLFFLYDIVAYLVEVSVVVGLLWWFEYWDNGVG